MKLNLPLTLESVSGKKANFHTHTFRCQHATGEDREYVEKAIEAGYEVLGFSDHIPHVFEDDYVSGIRMTMGQMEGYITSIQNLKKEYAKDIDIYCGFEAEYFPCLFDRTMEQIFKYPLDYMILGQHFMETEIRPNYVGRYGQTEDTLKKYVDHVIEALDRINFLYVAHPDVIKYTDDLNIFNKHMLRLLQELKNRNIPVEINMAGYCDGRHYPGDHFLNLALQNGNTFIMGVDAHAPEELLDFESYYTLVSKVEKHGGVVINKL